jgi:lipopolysaccharide export system permease protein
MGKIVHRYIFRELVIPFLFGLSVFTFVLLIARLLRLIELVVNRGVPATNILRIFAYIVPAFLEVTVPMAMLLAIIVAFGRLSADSEMVAFRSSGLSLYQLITPVVIFVSLAGLITAGLTLWARPWGNRSLRSALFEIARTRASAGIRQQVFNDEFPGLVIYAEEIDATTDTLRHVLISDDRDEKQRNHIFAREGVMLSDTATETVTLRLRDGFIQTSDARRGTEYQTDFQSYDVNLDLRRALAGSEERERDPKEMALGELRQTIATKRAAGTPSGLESAEYHRRISLPFACLVFGLAAVPLGIQPARGVRARGFAVSIVLIFFYYILLSAGQALAEQRLLPAVVGLWLPNVVFLVFGTYLFRQAARERGIVPLEWLDGWIASVRTRIAARLRVEPS